MKCGATGTVRLRRASCETRRLRAVCGCVVVVVSCACAVFKYSTVLCVEFWCVAYAQTVGSKTRTANKLLSNYGFALVTRIPRMIPRSGVGRSKHVAAIKDPHPIPIE